MANFEEADLRRNRIRDECGGRPNGYGGDTGMHSNQLFYCGQFRQECRCNECDGFCGPDGCPCNACVELVNFKVNKSGHLCRKGTIENHLMIGQEHIKATDLFYCGQMKYECHCGKCDGICGPNDGCPCFDCLELVDMKVNQLGDFCQKVPSNIMAHHLNRPSSELFYCGKHKYHFVCGICVGICDPNNGCPCTDCFKLLQCKMNRLGDVCYLGTYVLNAGHTGIPCKDLYYCNKLKNECHCGNCDGNCGPADGCPCFDCLELVGLSVLPERFTTRICKRNKSVDAWRECPCDVCKNYEQQIRNSRGHIAVKGDVEGSGGYTNVEPKNLYYCGVVRNECRCGICDGRCGPSDGCPCSSCLELYFNQTSLMFREKQALHDSMPATVTPSMDSPNENCCVICLDSQKTTILVPCGHYAFCQACADGIVECAICRARIEKRVKVFEG